MIPNLLAAHNHNVVKTLRDPTSGIHTIHGGILKKLPLESTSIHGHGVSAKNCHAQTRGHIAITLKICDCDTNPVATDMQNPRICSGHSCLRLKKHEASLSDAPFLERACCICFMLWLRVGARSLRCAESRKPPRRSHPISGYSAGRNRNLTANAFRFHARYLDNFPRGFIVDDGL